MAKKHYNKARKALGYAAHHLEEMLKAERKSAASRKHYADACRGAHKNLRKAVGGRNFKDISKKGVRVIELFGRVCRFNK